MAGTGVRDMVLLTLGWADLPLSVSIDGAPADEWIRKPVPGVLLLVDGGWLLLDTGFNSALLHDPALGRRFHGNRRNRVILPGPGEPLDEAERHAIFRIDFDDPSHDWRLADGDAEIAPGVTAVLTAGHTPGHQSFVIDFDDSIGGGGYVLAFDAADLTENIEGEVSVGSRVHALPEECVEQVRRLKALAAARGYPLIPGHDPVVWPSLTHEVDMRFGRSTKGRHPRSSNRSDWSSSPTGRPRRVVPTGRSTGVHGRRVAIFAGPTRPRPHWGVAHPAARGAPAERPSYLARPLARAVSTWAALGQRAADGTTGQRRFGCAAAGRPWRR